VPAFWAASSDDISANSGRKTGQFGARPLRPLVTLHRVNLPHLLLSARNAALWPTAAALLALPALPTMAQPLPAATLVQAQALVAQAAAALAPPGARIVVVPGALDGRLRLAPCEQIQPYLPTGARPWGASRVGLRCTLGARPWNVNLPVTVRVLAPALVATVPLPAGAVIDGAQWTLAEVDWAADASAAQPQAESLKGRTLARAVAAGQALRAADLRPRQWFAAGDTVRVVAVGSGFSVSGEGQALAAGVEGQAVRVRTENGRIVSGMPLGARRVEVAL
jgi:flagellar basal body P-ring formation protein FlgA